MAKKGKIKISKVKRNNQTTNKMRKAGQLKLQRHKPRVQKQKERPREEPEYSSEGETGDEWADMLDDEEQKYIMTRIAQQPQLLSNVPEKDTTNKRGTKRKKERAKIPKVARNHSDSGAETDSDSNSDVEEGYEREMAERPAKKMRPLLPIKTKEGVFERAEECDDTESETEDATKPQESSKPDKEDESSDAEADSGMEGTADDGDTDGVITAVDLMAARRDKLNHDKLRIGALCSSLLECPEKKLRNLFPILYLMEERLKDGALNLQSVRKLATLSAAEVFSDILPDYYIRHQDYSNVKLKKDTLAMYKYEKELLEFYKRYLQRLEKAFSVLRRKKGDNRKLDESTTSVALVSLKCMCGLLVSRPQFNYSTNIAQSLVPFLDSRLPQARAMVTECCVSVFGDDRKGEITLTIVRLINQLVKRRGERLQPSALDCLLSLKIRDVDLDEQADLQHKKRQEEKHKKRIVNLSKKEKKRAKKLKEVERELLETEAQESEAARKKQLTEVTRTVFHIYFRLLKAGPGSGLLAAALDGLAKFTHVINLEYYSDLVSLLSRLVRDEATPLRTRLQCVRAVLRVLASAGDALNIDPACFHTQLYCDALAVHAGANHNDAKIILEAVSQICARARRVSPAVLQAFAKRLTTLATQLHPNGAIAALALVHDLVQHKSVSMLLEPDETAGSGRFDPLLLSPEHCNAHSAALHELCVLRRHQHPTVRAAAVALLQGSWPQELGKLSPIKIFEDYDASQMSFKPAVPPPKKVDTPAKTKPAHTWTQSDFKTHCESIETSVHMKLNEPVVR
ncbi:nucleolar complex protein 3 [Epargyreus clarus]|uniref:nucleolar complex protein 3 n=1 Tax=Epargyreus clarus TaxID=520877 RepID=UPI003C2F8D3D